MFQLWEFYDLFNCEVVYFSISSFNWKNQSRTEDIWGGIVGDFYGHQGEMRSQGLEIWVQILLVED